MGLSVALEVSAESRPGRDRGIGRYIGAVRNANGALGNDLREIRFRIGNGRLSEFRSLVPRSVRVRATNADLFHALSPYYVAPFVENQVVSILDVIPLEVASHKRTGFKAAIFHRLAARARVIVTLSEHAKRRIVDLLNVPQDRVIVASLPSELRRASTNTLELPSRYIVAMTDLRVTDPRKRIEWLEGVASQLALRGIPLVIAGPATEHARDRFSGALTLGRLDDSTLAELLGRARALVYTSAYEGQGLPPLEAIRLGTPVVAMRNTSIPEVVGDAGILIDEDLPAPQAAQGPHRTDAPGARRLAEACGLIFDDDQLHARLAAACDMRRHLFTHELFQDGIRRAYDLARM